ncbi:DUF2460 domain-containing protein [Magnetococcales bacterium HHB-1]
MSNGFLDIRFPDSISKGSTGGPVYSTTINETASGREQRNINWQYPRHRYNAANGVKRRQHIDEILSFWHVVYGRGYGFRYRDPLDFKSCASFQAPTFTDQVLGTGNGSQKAFQLIKTYQFSGYQKQRLITKPVENTVAVALNGVQQNSGWSVDYSTGTLTFDSAPAEGSTITAGYQFDVPCRFEVDNLEILMQQWDINQAEIPIIEIRV